VNSNPDINSSTNATSYANSSWTPPTTGLIILFVGNWISSGPNTPTVSGNSLTWVQIATATHDPGTARRTTLFGADATGATPDATTIDFAGQTQLGCNASFFHAEGVDLSGGVTAAFVQTPSNTGVGTSGTVTLAAAGHADNRPIAAWNILLNEAITPDAAWTEVDDQGGTGPTRHFETQWDSDGFQNASASWTTSDDWLGMAAELKATVAGGAATHPGWYQSSGGWF